jgi:hypothetical protein
MLKRARRTWKARFCSNLGSENSGTIKVAISPLVKAGDTVYVQRRLGKLGSHITQLLNGFNAMANYSKYQQNVIKNYYNNQEAILLQRLGEQITELYLADGKARAKRWKDIIKVLEKLKVPASRIETLQKQDNPALLAKLLEELLAKQK